ncbi:MAG: SAM-dependent methyltransferase [Proteobacteria bacterium]|nr:SAM-dependent methyltransferase [Pseudomonadota bacterium]
MNDSTDHASDGRSTNWTQHKRLYQPEQLTQLLVEGVPAAKRADIRYTSVDEGACESLLPLTLASSNQFGTHQATVVALAGDYTGGAALGTVLFGAPLLGFHLVHGTDSACLWLAKFEIEYHRPSSDDLFVRASVPEAAHEGIRERFWKGAPSLIPIGVRFYCPQGELVAEGQFVYYLRHSGHMAPSSPEKKGGVMWHHMLKASARLIANVRGRESGRELPLYEDSYSREAAGKHGEILGQRFLAVLPQLQDMVAARTRALDDQMLAAMDAGVRQVVVVGAGLDFRPFRMAQTHPGVRYFELDLPIMLAERERVMARMTLPEVDRVGIPINLLFESPLTLLRGRSDFDTGAPVFVSFEGCSMYFEDGDAERILAGLAALLGGHSDSRLWLDLVSERVARGEAENAAERAFLDGMAKLGEPFVYGTDDASALFAGFGLRVLDETRSDCFRPQPEDGVFAQYRFALVGPERER